MEKNKEITEKINYMHVKGTPIPKSVTTYTKNKGGKTTVIKMPPVVDSPAPELPQKSNEELINELIKNERVRDSCRTNAVEINEKMNGNWFTIDQVIKKTNIRDLGAALGIMDIICLLGMGYRKIVGKDVIKYKITLSDNDRLVLLNDELVEAEGKVLQLKSEIERISTKS